MKGQNLCLCILLLTVNATVLNAQLSNSYPAYFHSIDDNGSSDNPSIYNHDDKYVLNSQYKSFLGLQSEIKVYNFQAYLLTERNHRWGVRLKSEQEGDFVQRNRLNLVYAIDKSLSKDVSVSFSSYLGGLFYTYSSIGNFQGGSDQGLDLGFSGALNYNKLLVGVSANQLNQTVLQPLSFQYDILRYFDFILEYPIAISPRWDLYTLAKHRKTKNLTTDITQFHVRGASTDDRYSFGLNYLVDLGVSPFLGVNIPYGKSKQQVLCLGMLFYMALNNNPTGDPFMDRQYEITLGWKYLK